MILLVQAVSVVLICLIGMKIMKKSATTFSRCLGVALTANALSSLIFIFGFGKADFYGGASSLATSAGYLISSTALGVLALVGLSSLFDHYWLIPPADHKASATHLSSEAACSGRKKRISSRSTLGLIGSILLGSVLGFLAGLFFFVPLWFYKSLGDIPADHFMFLITSGGGESTEQQDAEIINHMITPVILTAIIGGCAGLIRCRISKARRRGIKTAEKRGSHNLKTPILAVLATLSACSVVFAFQVTPLAGVLKQQLTSSDYVEKHYVAPTAENLKLPEHKRNLIHIYMESVENSYYDRRSGGYMENNLMPELEKLSASGVSFSNTATHGGPEQLYASGHSIAAMVNMWAGVPMLASGAGDGTQMSYPDFTTIGDILKDAGYNTQFMLGASAKWGGLGDYYRRHGDFDVFDLYKARDKGLIPREYHEWWGYEDDKLYDYAKTEMTRLGSDDKPFYLVLENADTHFPDGYVSKNMTDKPFEQQYANVIHYSQAETVKLIDWIQSQPWAKDTTIVVTGDHRSMDKKFFKGWDSAYNRTIVNFILNPVQGNKLPQDVTNNRTFAPFDFFPTILSSIGAEISSGRLGLGTDLFTGHPTLLEQENIKTPNSGVTKLNDEFARNSAFYDSHRETQTSSPDRGQDAKF